MPDPFRVWGAPVLARLRHARNVFCGLDYDGTLAPIAPTPDTAVPYPGTAALLADLAAAPHTRVAIVTGRSIADVRRFLDVDGAYYVGVHGVEVRRPGAGIETNPVVGSGSGSWPPLAAEVARRLGTVAGVFLEDKGVAVAAHYRGANADDAARTRVVVESLGAALIAEGAAIEVLHGHAVVELRPRGIDKGTTLRRLIASDAPGSLALYIGDDRTDEDAFRALPPDSITVHVGPEDCETSADHAIANPAEVHTFLQQLLQTRRA